MRLFGNSSILALSHFIYLSVIFICCLAEFHTGRFEFPEVTYFGQDAANEFQMILPGNVRFTESTLSSSASTEKPKQQSNYRFVSISPLKISNDEIVSVQYHSETPDSKNDWIGAYSPANVDITTTVPVKYGYCGEDASYGSTGSGLLTFNFTNLRSDIIFYYFTGGTKFPISVQKSTHIVTFHNPNQPLRPRIVPNDMNGDSSVFKLVWSSFDSTTPVLKWGIVQGEYIFTHSAETSTITRDQMCGAPASTIGWRDPGLIHTALFELQSLIDYLPKGDETNYSSGDLKIYYIIGDESTKDMSEEYTFFVPSMPGKQPLHRPTTLVLLYDMGRGSTDMTYTWNEYGRPAIGTTYSVAALVQQGQVDAVFHGGDISYAVGYSAVWDFFLDMISPFTRSALYLSIVGNHEIDFPKTDSYYTGLDSGGECGVQTLSFLPEPYPATIHQPWWSYDIGLIHIVGMSTENDFTTHSTQYNWLENDLKKVNRTLTPWILFTGHRPMYINSDYHGDKSSDTNVMNLLIKHIEPLLFKYRVNLSVYGHNHVMQRHSAVFNKTVVQASRPVVVHVEEDNTDVQHGKSGEPQQQAYKNYTIHYHDDPQATVHMVIGTAGAGFSKNAYKPPYAPLWNELVFYEYGYAVVKAMNASYLSWEFIESSSGTDQILDRMVITQSTHSDKDFTQPWVLPTTTTTANTATKAPVLQDNMSNNYVHPVLNNMLNILLFSTVLICSCIFMAIFISSVRKFLRSTHTTTVFQEASRRMGHDNNSNSNHNVKTSSSGSSSSSSSVLGLRDSNNNSSNSNNVNTVNTSNSNRNSEDDDIHSSNGMMTRPLMIKEMLMQGDDDDDSNNNNSNNDGYVYNPLPGSDQT